MAIKLHTLVKDNLGTVAKIIVIDSAESYRNFQKLIQNGSGLYPDLPSEVKSFADEVTVGRVQQAYEDAPAKLTAAEIEAAFATAAALPKHCAGCGFNVRTGDDVCHNCFLPLVS